MPCFNQIIVLLLLTLAPGTEQASTLQHELFEGKNGLPLFVRFEGKNSLYSIEIEIGATSQDLYNAVALLPESCGRKQLLFQSKAIRRDDIASLGDLGIGAQSHIEVHPESEAVGLYHLVSNLENKEEISWFADAEFCADDPRSDRCTVDAICGQWRHQRNIMCQPCDHSPTDEVFNVIERIELRTGNSTDADVGGCLSLQSLPKTVGEFVVAGHQLTSVDLSGLRAKDLQYLILCKGQISEINFDDLEDSSLRYLDLQSNLMEDVNLGDIIKSGVEGINLSHNRIHSFTFTQHDVDTLLSEGQPKQYLSLDGNPLDSFSMARWKYLQLRVLHARNELNRYHVLYLMRSDNLCRNCVGAVSGTIVLGIMGRMLMRRH